MSKKQQIGKLGEDLATKYLEEKNYKDDVLVLANINPDDGYAIVNRNELEKDYEIKQFKDYEYYIKRTRAVNVNSNLSSL